MLSGQGASAHIQGEDALKQVFQSLRGGDTEVLSVPRPAIQSGQLLIRSIRTLVSAGTERMLLDFGKASLIGKSRQQPDKVQMVLERIRTDGLIPTIEAVSNRLDVPLPMGYCNIGYVVERGGDVRTFSVGDRVVSNGKHAEFVAVPKNLCARVPDKVSDDEAAFTVIGAVGLHGIRLAEPTLGEFVVVVGLGLVGLVTVQLLRAHGCRVLGLDYDAVRLALAAQFGAEIVDLSEEGNAYAAAEQFSRGRGVDAVIIAAATNSSEPIRDATKICRKRGRIVLVGTAGLVLTRSDFYEKELSFRVSCSYGPGRYDPDFEERGFDYPAAYVRWTEQRNFEAVLDMMADGRMDVKPLISHRFPVESAPEAYAVVMGSEPSMGVLLEYDAHQPIGADQTIALPTDDNDAAAGKSTRSAVTVGCIGAGNYANAMLIPAFKRAGARLYSVASMNGASSMHAAKKYGFAEATTDVRAIVDNPRIDAVVISTRHDTHADLVCDALSAGKSVFVEKPLALSRDELTRIEDLTIATREKLGRCPVLMVGFNRRFAPHVMQLKQHLVARRRPVSIIYTVNAGSISLNHWTQDPVVGGGRIVGECCHFIDLIRFLVGSDIAQFSANSLRSEARDTATIALSFADGSLGSIHYFANGHRSFPKERIEIFSDGRIARLDNFRQLVSFGWPELSRSKLWRQDKGQFAAAKAFIDAVLSGGPPPILFSELVEVAEVTIAVGEAIRA